MEMSAYLGRKGVPVALAVPFDGTQSFATPSNVARVLNLTHADYGRVYRGAGFHGSISNVDVSSDRNIDHLNIDKSARLHTQVIGAILAVVGNGNGNQKPGPRRMITALPAPPPRLTRGTTALPNREIRSGPRPSPPMGLRTRGTP
jgi:hypothetical protein